MRKALIVLFLMIAGVANGQTYTNLQWGINKGAVPYQVGAFVNNSWRNIGTISAAGAWSIPTSNLSFTQLGTGAINQTVDAKLKSLWVSITDFCTDAQIASDMTSCAQAAINSVAPPNNSYGGGTVYFPARSGPYTFTGTLRLDKSFVRLKGENAQGSYLNCANQTGDCVVIGSLTGATRNQSIEDISINGNGLKTAGANVKIQGDTFGILFERAQIESCITCIDIGPGNNGTTLQNVVLTANQATSLHGIYWHAPGDGSARNDVLTLNNVIISGMLGNGNYGPATGLLMEGFVNTTVGSTIRVLHMTYGLRVIKAPGAVGYAYDPSFLNWHDFEAEGFNARAVSIEAGSEFRFTGSDMNNMAFAANQTGVDDYAFYDAGADVRGVMIANSRLGNSRRSGLYTNANNTQLSNVQFFSTSLAYNPPGATTRYPVIDVGSSDRNSVFTNIVCEEKHGAGRASNCIRVASGAQSIKAAAFDIANINDVWYSDPGNALGWNAAKGGFGTFNPAVDSGQSGLRVDQNATTNFSVLNINTGASAQARFDLATGTASSYCLNSLNDNAGSPFWSFSCGSAVNYAQWDVPLRLGSTVRLKGYTVSTLPTCNATAEGSIAYVTDATAPTYDGSLTGGGAVKVPAFCNGSAWRSH